MVSGFFTRDDAKRSRRHDLPIDYLHRQGAAGVRHLNPQAKHPCMPPTGSKHPEIYVLGEAAGKNEDEHGEQFVGKSGKLLRGLLRGVDRITWDNCCRTRPPDNRTPTRQELECFRPDVTKSIEERKPKIVLGVGGVPLSWQFPDVGMQVTATRGRRFPVKIGSHTCWFYSILHPAYILRIERGEEKKIPGREWRKVFDHDVERAVHDLTDLPTPVIEPHSETDLFRGVELVMPGPDAVRTIISRLNALSGVPVATLDLETNCLRPYRENPKVLTVAISTFEKTVAFPLERSEMRLITTEQRKALLKALRSFLASPGTKIIHNLAFESEWFVHLFGPEGARLSANECTLVQSYVLDERPGGHSLDFLTCLHLGFPLKGLSDVTHNEKQSLGKLLRYNALDAKYTFRVWQEQSKLIRDQVLQGIYQHHLRTVSSAVLIQHRGLPVDVEVVEAFQADYGKKIHLIEEEIRLRPEVKEYERRYGRFNPASTQSVAKLFQKILEREEGKRGEKYTTDRSALDSMHDPFAALIVKYRELTKIKGTYVDRMHPQAKQSYVYPDGRIHPLFKTTATVAGRSASEDPNGQNFPHRTHPEIRKQIVPPRGHIMVACDYGQQEFRVMGCASQDKAVCEAIWNDYDIHLDWAKRVADAWPDSLRARNGDLKKMRSDIKSEMTFPAFYGAGAPHIAKLLKVPQRIVDKLFEEFWDYFRGVKAWQERQLRFYQENRYIQFMNGRRRRAPLSPNMIFNSPIQGDASDIVMDAMNRLSELAVTSDRMYLQPILNIHDDLSFFVPEDQLEPALEIIIREMTAIPYKWVTVPLQVEVSVGPNWYELKEIGKFIGVPKHVRRPV